MKKISLTHNQITCVDNKDYDWLMQWPWYAQYSRTTRSYLARSHGKLMHRVILGISSEYDIDHKDHNTLNNQRRNLRLCNDSQNGGNRRKHIPKSSIYKGVSWYQPYHKWVSRVTHNHHTYLLGYFDDETQAVLAYDTAAQQLFGEFAHCNLS